jgi:glycine oxidase
MLSVVPPTSNDADRDPAAPHLLRHVVRAPDVYLVPRSDGRIVIGSTLEEAGFDKHVEAATVQRLHAAAVSLLPKIAEGKILQSWAGLRPATPDLLPILGQTEIKGYFTAAGHYRDGILLAPITAEVMREVISGLRPELDLSAFTPSRFV